MCLGSDLGSQPERKRRENELHMRQEACVCASHTEGGDDHVECWLTVFKVLAHAFHL